MTTLDHDSHTQIIRVGGVAESARRGLQQPYTTQAWPGWPQLESWPASLTELSEREEPEPLAERCSC